MNFVLHRAFALHELGDELAGVGAMLPDLWRMAHRRVRVRDAVPTSEPRANELVAGIRHHLAIDAWFHSCRLFRAGERDTAVALGQFGVPKLRLFAHMTWEMCLDGAWLRSQRLNDVLRAMAGAFEEGADVLEEVADAHGAHRLDAATRLVFSERTTRIIAGVIEGPWIAGYRHGAGIVERLEGVRRRFGIAPLTTDVRARAAALLDERLEVACEVVPALFAERAKIA